MKVCVRPAPKYAPAGVGRLSFCRWTVHPRRRRYGASARCRERVGRHGEVKQQQPELRAAAERLKIGVDLQPGEVSLAVRDRQPQRGGRLLELGF